MELMEGVEVFCQNSIKIKKEKTIYIDPYKISTHYTDADYVFITHAHPDHYSPQAINMVKTEKTLYVVTEDLKEKVKYDLNVNEERILTVKQNEIYDFEGLKFTTVPAYNTGILRKFHLKIYGWVGYIIRIGDADFYIAGDTDANDEITQIKCDVAFVPIGGTYTMEYKEAASLINTIKPKIAVPVHYGEIVGRMEDGEKFVSLLDPEIEGKILIKK